MPRGLQVPLGVSKSGGAKLEDEARQLDKLVVLALLEGGDDNPFQELGLSPSILYRDNSDESKFDTQTEISQKLETFKDRLKLSEEGVIIEEVLSPEDENEYTTAVSFEYVNLDTDELRQFSAPFIALGSN